MTPSPTSAWPITRAPNGEGLVWANAGLPLRFPSPDAAYDAVRGALRLTAELSTIKQGEG